MRISAKHHQQFVMPAASKSEAPHPWKLPDAAQNLTLKERVSITWNRSLRWEFWPAWLFYIPIVMWIIYLGIRHRNPTAFTAANSALDNGGVVGERKHQALEPLQKNALDLVARFELIVAAEADQRFDQLQQFMQRIQTGYPVVLKPDVGQRGRGVFVAKDAAAAQDYLSRFRGSVIAQEFIAGEEFGVFISRDPADGTLEILSIVHKVFPSVIGDGKSSLRQLITQDARARLIAETLFERWQAQLHTVPQPGERIVLVHIGSHCRGSLFLNAGHLRSTALATTLERMADAVPGYRFGRIDLRAPSEDALKRGQGLKVLEMNGVTSECAHIYHPGTPLLSGYKVMFRQWAVAFKLGHAQLKQGASVTSPFELLRLFRADLKRGQEWF